VLTTGEAAALLHPRHIAVVFSISSVVDHFSGRHLRARFDRVEIIVDGARVDLTRRELALLRFLVSHRNLVLGRPDLLQHVWMNENDGRTRTVDVHIRRLRMKLGAAGRQIETVPGIGYRFNEEDSSAGA
jgi:DNA-binding response OmpR family regulator